jgi:hypothetical protein
MSGIQNNHTIELDVFVPIEQKSANRPYAEKDKVTKIKTGKIVEDISVLIPCVAQAEGQQSISLIIKMRVKKVGEVIKAGKYRLSAPSSFFKDAFLVGMNVYAISFAEDSDRVEFLSVK